MLSIACLVPLAGEGQELEMMRAAAPVETRHNRTLAPSSSLGPPAAMQLALQLSRQLGGDIVIMSVKPTGSMRPYFNENALLLLEAAPFESLRVGDVVTFKDERSGSLIGHRLVEKRRGVFWAKGDHNSRMDEIYVTPQNYQRRLVGIVYMDPQRRQEDANEVTATRRDGTE